MMAILRIGVTWKRISEHTTLGGPQIGQGIPT